MTVEPSHEASLEASQPPAKRHTDVTNASQPATAPSPDGSALPERPKLAPGVKLAGQMQESAFVNPPWLLEREGAGYVQVTELLYRIAEQCTGRYTVEEIAARLTDAGTPVSPPTVQALIARLLVPRGLVAGAGGSVAEVASLTPSPLALNMRMTMIPPERIEPVTGLLKFLFWPPVLVLVLLIAATMEGWVNLVHGVAGGVHDALYAPGLILFVLSGIVIAAAFHELGHATALHYAGGHTRGMGAGMYVVYPAFYTDVSDNYRLPRWARVRTDLAGFYFNLIFALGLFGLYQVTGQEFLLFVVVLINLEIVHQLMPFLRLDGYWALADVTGVPDFLSQIGAFVRSVLPIPGWQGRKLPPLKWWGKIIFALYTLITVPLLVLLLLLMVKSVPRVLATAWDSFQQQTQTFGQAQSQADVLGMGGSVAQIVFLALPTLGLLYTLFSLGKALVVGVWKWSQPTPTRRVIGIVGMLVTLGVIALLWAPQLPFGGGQPGPLYDQVRFEPIGANERGTLIDAITGTVATREGTGASTPAPEGSPAAGATPAATEAAVAPTREVEPTAAALKATSVAAATATPAAQATATAVATQAPVRGAPTRTP